MINHSQNFRRPDSTGQVTWIAASSHLRCCIPWPLRCSSGRRSSSARWFPSSLGQTGGEPSCFSELWEINHHSSPLIIISHHYLSWMAIHHHISPYITMNHHESPWIDHKSTMNHQRSPLITINWSIRVPLEKPSGPTKDPQRTRTLHRGPFWAPRAAHGVVAAAAQRTKVGTPYADDF